MAWSSAMDKLAELGSDDNTVVFVMSDNGGLDHLESKTHVYIAILY